MDKNDSITDQTILGLAEADILSSAQYPRLKEDWPGPLAASKAWAEWKHLALIKHKCVETHLAAQWEPIFSGEPPIRQHSPIKRQPPPQRQCTMAAIHPLPGNSLGTDVMAKIKAAFNNFSCAARSDTDSMAELVKSNVALICTNKKLVAKAANVGGVVRDLHAQLV